MNPKVRVAVNGYGVIGKRVADAVRLQPDMELVGVSDVVGDYRIQVAEVHGIPVYAMTEDAKATMKEAGVNVQGTLPDLLGKIDVIVDCTPRAIASKNKTLYDSLGIKSIFQGAEKHALTGHSFVAQANYATALNRNATRVVSCNTTSIVRTLGALHKAGLVKKGWGTLARRAVDPWASHEKGIMNTLVPELHVPSHQAPDAQTIIPDLNLTTMALLTPQSISHAHAWQIEMPREASRDEVLEVLRDTPRLAFVRASDGITALNCNVELVHDLGRSRGDMWEVVVWEDILDTCGNELYMFYQVHNMSIVIPENVDAIRALSGIEESAERSIAMTNETLGIVKDLLRSGLKALPNAHVADAG